tara:strand:- start:246 stop:374 length:129 start_codon:yes stop_codon:yes gene_type:complete
MEIIITGQVVAVVVFIDVAHKVVMADLVAVVAVVKVPRLDQL